MSADQARRSRRRISFLLTAAVVSAACLLAIVLTGSFFNRELTHNTFLFFLLVSELTTVAISFSIFITGWYGNRQQPNSRILAISITFFGVAILDFVHALSYNGMPVFLVVNSIDKTVTYRMAARLIAGIGLLAMVFITERKPPKWLNPRLLLAGMCGLVLMLILVENYAPGFLPEMFIPGKGLTPLKIILEYFVIALNIATIAALWGRRVFDLRATVYLQTALVVSIFSELSLTLYTNPYDSYNVLARIFKMVAYYLILRSIFVSSLQQPYRQLDRARQDLENSFGSIGTALASSLELDKTLELIARLAAEMLHSSYALVALRGNKPGVLEVRATLGIPKPPPEIPLDDKLALRVIQKKQPIFLPKLGDPGAPFFSHFAGRNFRSAVAAPIIRNDAVLGILAVYSRQPGACDEPDARLLAAFARQAAVAIGNSRLFERELDARAKITSYVDRLSILHEIGLSLNRETNQKKLLDLVLKGATDLTDAGAAIMLLIEEDAADVASVYFPEWSQLSCEVKQDPASIHKGIARIIAGAGNRGTVRLTDLSGLEPLPPRHLRLHGLMIATIHDIRGNVRGHFMLTAKKGGAEFTEEDEQVIALLAAQCSVAVTSAENFEREHYVAATLQNALLPRKPVRADLDVGLLYRSAFRYARVGGDFYDFIELDDHRTVVAVGDVCGKGLEAATYTALIKYMLRAYVDEGLLPGDCLSRLNQAVLKEISSKDPEKFITMGLALINTEKGFVNYASAGHPPPLLCRDGAAYPLSPPQALPLGVLPDVAYLSSQIGISGACALFMYTDGLTEARPPGGEPFGQQRVMDSVSGRCCLDAQRVAWSLMQQALVYSGGSLRDDIALLVVRLLGK